MTWGWRPFHWAGAGAGAVAGAMESTTAFRFPRVPAGIDAGPAGSAQAIMVAVNTSAGKMPCIASFIGLPMEGGYNVSSNT